MTEVRAATVIHDARPYPVDYTPIDVAGGTSNVASTTAFIIQVDRLLLPESANRQSFCLQPLLTNVVTPARCSAGIFLAPAYDPVRREVTLRLTSDNPPLIAASRYELTLYAAQNPGDPGLVSFDGIGLAAAVQVEVGVLPNPPDGAPPWNLPPTGDHYCTGPAPGPDGLTRGRRVADILAGCSYSGCHAGNPDSAAEGMELGDVAGLLGTALGHVAHETETGEITEPQSDPLRFGQAMAIVDPGEPGSSYLLYKLLANHHLPLAVPFPPAADPDADPPEVARLRTEVVVGLPMPPSNAAPGSPLQRGDAEWLSEWILMGAKPAVCP